MIQFTNLDVAPGDNRTYKLNMSAVEEWPAGDTVASGTVSWTGSAPGTVGSITGSGIFLNVPLAGFVDATTYYGKFLVTSSSGAIVAVFVTFSCAKPTGF